MSTQSNAALQAEVDRLHGELEILRGEEKATKISIGNYILARLEQLGVTVGYLVSAIVSLLSFTLCYTSRCLVSLVISISGFW